MSWGVFGSILGAATNLWQSQRARKDAKSQFGATTLTARVNEAKRLGLSPLAVLGSPTASPTIMGSGQSDLGSQLKDVVNQIQKAQQKPKPPSLKNQDPLEVRAKLAEVRRMEADASLAEKQLSDTALATSPGQPRTTPEWQDPCPPDHLYCRRFDPITNQEVWHPNLKHWPDLGEASGAGAVAKSKISPKVPYKGNLETRKKRRGRRRGAPQRHITGGGF